MQYTDEQTNTWQISKSVCSPACSQCLCGQSIYAAYTQNDLPDGSMQQSLSIVVQGTAVDTDLFVQVTVHVGKHIKGAASLL